MSEQRQHNAEAMTFGEHLDALRPHLVRSAGVIMTLMVTAFCCKHFLVDTVLFGPMSAWFPTNQFLVWLGEMSGVEGLAPNPDAFQLVSTSMAGQFNLHMTISFVAAFAVGFPYLLWEVWRFVRPALTERELKGCRRFVAYVSSGFFIGLAFGYYVVSPFSIGFLTQYRVSERVTNMIDVNSYLSTVINVSLACAVVFQLPLLVHFLTRMGVLGPEFLRKYRRHAIVVLAVLAAIITPPDAFSMVMVLLPLWGLYELSIRISERAQKKRNAVE